MIEQLKVFINRAQGRGTSVDTWTPLHQPSDLRPKRLAGARVERVMFEEYPAIGERDRTQSINFYTALPNGIELLSTNQPYARQIVKPFAHSNKRTAFHQQMGLLRYSLSLIHLTHLYNGSVEFLGVPGHIEYQHRSYQPEGPWEYIPPEHAFDFRVRARCVIPVNPSEVSLTKLALHTTRFASRARYTIDYHHD
jgi:hypothetical protein